MSNTILDSGNRTVFYDENGNALGQRDIQDDKGRCDLLPLDVVAGLYYSVPIRNIFYGMSTFVYTGSCEHLYMALEQFSKFMGTTIGEMMLDVSMHYKQGAEKYGERNWEKGIPLHSFIDSGARHLLKHIDGQVDERHDRAFVWNILGAIWTMKHKEGTDLIDIPFELFSGKCSNTEHKCSETQHLEGVM